MCPKGCLIHAGNDSGTARGTHARRGKGMGVAHAFLGQLIEVGRDGIRVAITTEMRADILRR